MSIFWYAYVRETAYVRMYVRTYTYVYVRAHIHQIHTTTYTYVRTHVRTYDICTYVRTYAYTVATYIRMQMAVGNMPKMRVDPSEMNDNIMLVMTMKQDNPVRPAGPCGLVCIAHGWIVWHQGWTSGARAHNRRYYVSISVYGE